MSALKEEEVSELQHELEPRRLRRVLVGRPMRSHQVEDELLPVGLALPIFAADAISSVAYATEAAMVVLLGVGLAALHLALPIAVAVAALMAIVISSYRQTVRAYETSGGAYVVARENLGTLPSLVAAAALLVDYVLTVAVSVSSGVLAITSAVTSLEHYNTELSLAAVLLITIVNLRGVRESGLTFALPTYLFILAMLTTVAVGTVKCATGLCPRAVAPNPLAAGAGALTLFLVLRAFASGASALTGVEAIANGVNAFRHPQSKNAARTLGVLGVVAITMFLGVSFLAVRTHARPSSTDSVVSQVARAVFPAGSPAVGWMYWAVQITTFAVLVLAANTSFQGFPRLSALLAHDRFIARQFTNLGDRLVYSNGVVLLAGAAAFLIWIYHANVVSLIHLYVVGVFTAFTLSQAGMVRYWRRTHGSGWKWRSVINGIGAAATFVVMVVVVLTKFTEGAWMVMVAIPLMVTGFYGVRRHYRRVARRLAAGAAAVVAAPPARNTTLLLVESVDEAADRAYEFARAISPDGFRAVHVPASGTDPGIRPRWFRRTGGESTLDVLDPSGGVAESVLEQVWRLPRGESDFVTVVVPELFDEPSILHQARHPRELSLKFRLLSEPGVVVADVPVVRDAEEPDLGRLVARVLVSGVNAASMRAVNYATSLGIADTQAVHFAFTADEADLIRSEWRAHGPRVPLDVDDAPYRDLGAPLLRYLRTLTAEEGTTVLVLMPELVTRGWRRLLHNQRSLYLKRLLLFEPHVILASVPYQLLR